MHMICKSFKAGYKLCSKLETFHDFYLQVKHCVNFKTSTIPFAALKRKRTLSKNHKTRSATLTQGCIGYVKKESEPYRSDIVTW